MTTNTLEQFVGNLIQSGLMTLADVQEFRHTFPSERRPRDAQSLAKELVRAGKLTKYQATAIWNGKPQNLVFGEYVVIDKIGQGGMGVVVKAQHKKMKRLVAIKMLSAGLMDSPKAVKRFFQEVEAAGKLSHPNIVAAYDAGEHEGTHYLVMEYVDGQNLSRLVKDRGPLPLDEAMDYIVQAAEGLAHAHSEGIIHRDVKPGNLLIDSKGRVKILDMGLARIQSMSMEGTGDAQRLTQTGQMMGTCDYMAPEQATDSREADHRADIYGLGCTLYRALIGSAPYPGDTIVQTLMGHKNGPIPSLCAGRSDVPAAVDAIFRRMLAKKPEDRPRTMQEVIDSLRAAMAAPNLVPAPAPVPLPPVRPESPLSFLGELTPSAPALNRPAAPVEETPPSWLDRDTTNISRSGPPAPARSIPRWQIVVAVAVGVLLLAGVLAVGYLLGKRG